jgi:hypothetical protein
MSQCPLCPRKRTFATAIGMSALGQEATYAVQQDALYAITSSATAGMSGSIQLSSKTMTICCFMGYSSSHLI